MRRLQGFPRRRGIFDGRVRMAAEAISEGHCPGAGRPASLTAEGLRSSDERGFFIGLMRLPIAPYGLSVGAPGVISEAWGAACRTLIPALTTC